MFDDDEQADIVKTTISVSNNFFIMLPSCLIQIFMWSEGCGRTELGTI